MSTTFTTSTPIKNHLGSTVLVTNDDGGEVIEAYEYLPYGKKVTVVKSTESETHTFTGKELDRYDRDLDENEDGAGLYYFGARLLDPDIGMWTSTDPAEQYWSGYSYTGNGFNPINAIDPDGMKTTIVVNRNNTGIGVTKGTYSVSSNLVNNTSSGFTLEPPSNHATKNKISAATYSAFTRITASNGQDYSKRRVQLNNVTGENGNTMYGAQIHNGNTLDDTHGCILFGLNEGMSNTTIPTSVGASGKAMNALNSVIDADGSGEIKIIVNDPVTDN